MYVNAKIIPVELFQEWRGADKSKDRGSEFMYDIFDTL
jgi:hypothetical protein